MSNVIHGTGKPKIVIGVTEITLPYCESMDEYFEFDCVRHKINGGDINKYKKGWYYRVELNYPTFMKKSVLESLEPLFDVANSDFEFYPRLDNTAVHYTVDLPEDYEFHFAQRQAHFGHKGIQIVLEGSERLSSIDLTNDPVA